MKAACLLTTLCAAFVLAVVASTPLLARQLTVASQFIFEVRLHSPTPGVAQLFYDIGKGLREQDSARVQLDREGVVMFSTPVEPLQLKRSDPARTGPIHVR